MHRQPSLLPTTTRPRNQPHTTHFIHFLFSSTTSPFSVRWPIRFCQRHTIHPVSHPPLPPTTHRTDIQNPLNAHEPHTFSSCLLVCSCPSSFSRSDWAGKLSVPAAFIAIIILIFICCTTHFPSSSTVRCVIRSSSSNNNKTATRMQCAPQRRNNEMKTLLFWDNCAKITTKDDPAMFYLHRGMNGKVENGTDSTE